MNICVYIYVGPETFFLDAYLRVELLDLRLTLFNLFWNCRLFSKSFDVPTNSIILMFPE